jgi:putative ABC transport system permease protein
MIAVDISRLAARNLREAKLRTALTTTGVAIGVGALTCMVSFGVGIQEQLFGQFLKSGLFDTITVTSARLGVGPGMGGRPERTASSNASGAAKARTPAPLLDDDALKKLATIDRVREVYPNVRVPVEIKYGSFSEFTVAAGVPMSARNEGVFRNISRGSFFPDDAAAACILSQNLAERMAEGNTGKLIGRKIRLSFAASPARSPEAPAFTLGGISLKREEKEFTIAGVLESGSSMGFGMLSPVMIPLNRAIEMGVTDISNPQTLLSQLSDRRTYSAVTVKVKRPEDVDEAEKEIKDMGFTAFSLNDAMQGAKRGFLLLDLLLGLIGSIALTVASLGIVNTMVMSILERTREIGIMKAVGGDDRDIRLIFLVEASIIGLTGGVLGILLGWVVGRAINFGANIYIQSQGGPTGDLFSLPAWLVGGAILFSILLSLLAGSYPASRAARLDPIQALRHD